MADTRLERMRQMMREEAEKKNGTNRTFASGDNASYPFWDIPEDTTALIRFLPDKDESNPWFWAERQTIKLPFAGTIGGESPTDKQVTVTVPCVDMFGDVCPIIAETRPWWKDDAKKETARLYYKKRSYITQGFVVSSPFAEQSVPENPMRRFMIGNELVQKLKAGLADIEMENDPTDYMLGTDFKIRKTKKGEHNNYSTSEWARRSRPLSETEVLAIEQHGLFNLADFRGARPDADGVAAIKAMFHASLRGDPYDFAEFGKFSWRPYGASGSNMAHDEEADDAVVATTRTSTKASTVQASASEEDDGVANKGKPQPAAILAKLRDRVTSKA